MVTVNVVVLAGTVSVAPIEKEMPSGDKMIEFRLSVPEAGKRLLPLPVVVWDRALVRTALKDVAKGDEVLVHGQLSRRYVGNGSAGRALMEVVATGMKKLRARETE